MTTTTRFGMLTEHLHRGPLWLALCLARPGAALGHLGHSHAPLIKRTAEEIAAFKAAEPVFAQYCYRCHTHSGKKSKPKALAHLDMDQYPFGGHHAGEAAAVIRKVLGATGVKATMPSDDPGAVSGDALAKILAWADAFDRAHPSDAPAKPTHRHSHEDLK